MLPAWEPTQITHASGSTSALQKNLKMLIFYLLWSPNNMQSIQVNCTKGSGYWATHFAPVRLQFGEHYGWGFSPSVWGTTKHCCIFGWEGRTKEVRVWTESEWLPHWKTIPRPCSHCLWHVKRDGFYRQPNDADKAHASVFYVGWV